MTDKPAVQTSTVVKLPKSGLKCTAKKVFAVVATELMHNNLLDVYGVDMVVAYAREMALCHDLDVALDRARYFDRKAASRGIRIFVAGLRLEQVTHDILLIQVSALLH